MKIVCSYCRKDMGEKAPLEDKRISHGCCSICEAKMIKELEIRELLKKLDEPPVSRD